MRQIRYVGHPTIRTPWGTFVVLVSTRLGAERARYTSAYAYDHEGD